MNLYAVVILSALIFEYIMNLLADIFNLSALSGKLPEEFEGIYDAETYRKSQEYTRVKIKFGIIVSNLNLMILLAFWFAGGFQILDSIVRSWDLPPILTGIFYMAILVLMKQVLSLPFKIYTTFVIEERFGFNKTTKATFITDLLKGLMLTIIIGGPLLTGMLAFFQYAGNLAWLYCWIVTTVFLLLIQFIAPIWIMPLFYTFKPLETSELKQRIMDYVDSVKYPVSEVYIIDGSRRSSKSNAFFAGFGKNKRIALFDTLVEKHPVSELVAVIAHEVGHNKKKHILQSMVISILHIGLMFYLLSLFLTNTGLFEAFYMEKQSIYAAFVFFGMLFTPIEFVLSIFMNILSRHNEYQADRFATETTGTPEAMIGALKKLSANNLSNLTPHSFEVFMNYSHPPVLERIHAIRYR